MYWSRSRISWGVVGSLGSGAATALKDSFEMRSYCPSGSYSFPDIVKSGVQEKQTRGYLTTPFRTLKRRGLVDI